MLYFIEAFRAGRAPRKDLARQTCEDFDDEGIELNSGVSFKDGKGPFAIHSATVGAIGGHCIVGIGNMNDARVDECFCAHLTPRVSAAIPVFVMQLHCCEEGREALHTFQNPAADDRVLLDERQLLARESPLLLQNSVGDADLSDIVQQCANANAIDVGLVKAQCGCDRAGELADTPAVTRRVRIARVERICQRTDKLKVSPSRFSPDSRTDAAARLYISVSSLISRIEVDFPSSSGRTPVRAARRRCETTVAMGLTMELEEAMLQSSASIHADDCTRVQEQIVQPGLDRSCGLIDTLEIQQRVSTAVRLDGERNPVGAL